MEVRVLLSTSSSWLSSIIRWVTRSKASHAAVCVLVAGLPPLVLEATVGGVRATPRAKWDKDNRLVGEFKSRVPLEIAHACDHLGERYDYVGLLGYLPVMIGRWLGRKIKNPLAAPRALVCAEFVLHLDHEGLVPEWKGLDPEGTTPEDLLAACLSGSSFEAVQG